MRTDLRCQKNIKEFRIQRITRGIKKGLRENGEKSREEEMKDLGYKEYLEG